MGLWKVLGLAGLASVATAGVLISREQRQRQALSPDDVRHRLHTRHAEGTMRQGTPTTT